MKKKSLVQLGLGILLLAAALFVLPSFIKSEDKSCCCKENMKECPRKKATEKTPGLIWDDFSRQFFSFASISY